MQTLRKAFWRWQRRRERGCCPPRPLCFPHSETQTCNVLISLNKERRAAVLSLSCLLLLLVCLFVFHLSAGRAKRSGSCSDALLIGPLQGTHTQGGNAAHVMPLWCPDKKHLETRQHCFLLFNRTHLSGLSPVIAAYFSQLNCFSWFSTECQCTKLTSFLSLFVYLFLRANPALLKLTAVHFSQMGEFYPPAPF